MTLFSHPVISNSLWLHGLQHARPLCPSPSPRVCPSSCLPSHPLMPSSPALNLSQHQELFQWVMCSHQMTNILELQLQYQSFEWYSRLISLKIHWFYLFAARRNFRSLLQHHSLKASVFWCPWDFQESFPTPQFEGINSLAFCFLYSPALKTVHNHWEDHSLDYMDLCRQSTVSAFQHIV